MIIKCPNCGSSAQVRKNEPFVDSEGNYICCEYVCGCGCYFDPTAEEKYYELMEEKDRAIDAYYEAKNSCMSAQTIEIRELKMNEAIDNFNSYCVYIVEQLLDGYPRILKNIE